MRNGMGIKVNIFRDEKALRPRKGQSLRLAKESEKPGKTADRTRTEGIFKANNLNSFLNRDRNLELGPVKQKYVNSGGEKRKENIC